VLAERFARGFGTPHFIMGQTVIVALWIAANAVAFGLHWDPYPFILLNLAFSTQAALRRTADPARSDPSGRTRQDPRHRGARAPRRAGARPETFEFQLGLMLDGDRKREAAHQALLDRQSTLIDEVACALHDVQASGTMQD
jgi:hypothetical protein